MNRHKSMSLWEAAFTSQCPGCQGVLLQGGDVGWDQPSKGNHALGRRTSLRLLCPGMNYNPPFRLPQGSDPPSLLHPSPASLSANTIHQHTVLKARIRDPLQNQSSCLLSLLNTWSSARPVILSSCCGQTCQGQQSLC